MKIIEKFYLLFKKIAYIKYMKMKKSNKKILEATSKVLKEKERQRLYEAAQPHFKSEWDALCFELEHPSPEFIRLSHETDEILDKLDFSKVEVIKIKL